MDNIRNTLSHWIAPTYQLQPQSQPQLIKEEAKVEEPEIEQPKPKEITLTDKAEVVFEQAQKIAKIVGFGVIAFVALYSSLDKGIKVKAGRWGVALEATGNLTKFILGNDVKAGGEGLNTIIKLINKQIPSGKIIHV